MLRKALAFLLLTLPFVALAQQGSYKVNTKTSTIGWHAEKVTGEHKGNLSFSGGSVEVNGGKVTGGTLELNMASITVTDITDPGTNAKLVGHLKSDDFFSAEKHPKATLKIKSLKLVSGNNYTLVADLTIKGITNEISIPVTVAINGKSLTASSTFKLDRTKWDIRYGSKTFFASIGDKAIYDEFDITINLNAQL
jgi:polyisoprenoid-binding protein YceI